MASQLFSTGTQRENLPVFRNAFYAWEELVRCRPLKYVRVSETKMVTFFYPSLGQNILSHVFTDAVLRRFSTPHQCIIFSLLLNFQKRSTNVIISNH